MRRVVILLAMILTVPILVSPIAGASTFTGTPSPALSPVFGTLVNFDDKATGTPVLSNDYVGVGVASVLELEGLGVFARYPSTQSLPNYIGTGDTGERGNDADPNGWDGTIQFKFASPTDKVGIGIADSRGGPETLSIFDASHNLLESFAAPDGGNVYAGFDRATSDITYFEIKGDFFAVDDLQFNARGGEVPEPISLILLGSGLAGAGLYRRLRKP